MTFSFTHESDRWVEASTPHLCGRINVEIDLVASSSMQVELDYVFIEYCGQVFSLVDLHPEDMIKIKSRIEDFKNQYHDYLVDMKYSAFEMADNFVTDDAG